MSFRSSAYSQEYATNQAFADGIQQNTQRLVQRVEELEDLVIELKSKQSAGDIVEMKQLISSLELETNFLNEKIAALVQQRINSKDMF